VALEAAGFGVEPVRERPGFVEAVVSGEHQQFVVEWTRDSAFRFFPLVEDDDLGLMLHPFDLATNKVLALVGRLEARDWVDVIACHERLQPLAYLAWAASGKDPAFTPLGILEHAARSGRYRDEELAILEFEGPAPPAAALAQRWHGALDAARGLIERLPPAHVGEAVLTSAGGLFTGGIADVERAVAHDEIVFHPGRIGGALPRIRE
jgi:hypothetical protein